MNMILRIMKKLFKQKKHGEKHDWSWKIKPVSGVKADRKDSRDYHAEGAMMYVKHDPKSNLSKYCPAIKNQGNLGSCTGFAFAAAYEMMEYMMKGTWPDVSELYIYFKERERMGTIGRDSGAYLRDGCKVLKDSGASLEQFWPYFIKKWNSHPNFKANIAGRFTRIHSYYKCYTADDIKNSLSNSMPVVFGMMINESFIRHRAGVYKTVGGKSIGGHAMTIVGHDDKKEAFLVRNSWGLDWGAHGYGWVSYDVVMDNLLSAWVIIPFGWDQTKVL